MFTKKTRLFSGIIASAMALTAVGTMALVSAESTAMPDLTDKFKMVEDFETLTPANTLGANSSIGKSFNLESGGSSITVDLPADTTFKNGTDLYLYIDTNNIVVSKGWFTLVGEDGKEYSPDTLGFSGTATGKNDAGADVHKLNTFFQQNADKTWSEVVYSEYWGGDDGTFLRLNSKGYIRIPLSQFQTGTEGSGSPFNFDQKYTKLKMTYKAEDYAECTTKYNSNPIILDNIGFAGPSVDSEKTLADIITLPEVTSEAPVTSETPVTSDSSEPAPAETKGIIADLVNTVFTEGLATDSTGNTTYTVNGTPKIGDVNVKFDNKDYTTKGLEIASSNGNLKGTLSKLDRTSMTELLNKGFTIESFYVDKTPGGTHGIFCATQFAGFGLATKGNGLPYFLAHVGGGYKLANAKADGPTDSLTHVIGVFDAANDKVKIYVNGVLAESNAASGDLLLANDPMVNTFFLGADPKEGVVADGNEIVDYQMVNSTIISARAYSAAFDDAAALKAYNAAVARLK
ncbi:MAG: LamG-like jellyroll fold domain-containing protein, partial [Oscillospiraceae bacterium]